MTTNSPSNLPRQHPGTGPWRARLRSALALAGLLALLGGAGCASVESDMPWGSPQSWEGAPGIPGMSPPR